MKKRVKITITDKGNQVLGFVKPSENGFALFDPETGESAFESGTAAGCIKNLALVYGDDFVVSGH